MRRTYLKALLSKPLPIVVLAFFCITFSSIALDNTADAAVWNVNDINGGFRTGYFYGKYNRANIDSGGYVLQNGIPDDVGDNGDFNNPYPEIEEYINFIWGKYDRFGTNGSEWRDRVGASFIIHSMIGRPQPQDTIDVSDAEYNEWVTSLRQPGIQVIWNQEGSTTYDTYMSSDVDVARAEFGDDGDILTFLLNGNPVYRLNRACANPDGALGGFPPYTPPPPPPPFILTPSVSINPSSSVDIGQKITTSISVNSSGGGTSSGTQWQLSRFIVPPAGSYPTAQTENDTPPTTHYGNGATTPQSSTANFPSGVTSLGSFDSNADNRPVGSRICYALSVQPYTSVGGSTQWRHSAPACVVIAKKPKVQVLGGDLIVGRGSSVPSNVRTSTTDNGSSLYYGSWVEYAIIPSGLVTGMASGAGYAGGASFNPADSFCKLSLLTIANRIPGSCVQSKIGEHAHDSPKPNIAARFATSPSTPKIPKTNLSLMGDNLSGLYTADPATTAISITGGSAIPKGRWIAIKAPDATVTISGDIRYTTTPLSAIGDIPQVVIIAKNILIADSVENVDSWLITTGTGTDGRINTCGAGGVTEATTISAGNCFRPLLMNGPIVANHLVMRRTGGAGPGTQAGNPAEVFNLRADAFIWSTSYSTGTGRIPTVSTKELPPRF